MIDGATDNSVLENEVFHARVVQNGKPENKMLDLKALNYSHADGTNDGIKSAYLKVGMKDEEWKRKTVGFCADGATVTWAEKWCSC